MKIIEIKLVGSLYTRWLTVYQGRARLHHPGIGPGPNESYEINPDGSDVAQIAANFLTVIGCIDGTANEIGEEVHQIEAAIRLLYHSATGKEIGNYDFTPDDK